MTSPVLFRAERLIAAAAAARPVLGLDTGLPVASLALFAAGKIAGQRVQPAVSHGAGLPAAVAELLDSAGLALGDLGGIAVGIGPGSFTGLRVGLSYAKGIVMASGCAIFGIPTLDTIALAALDAAGERARIGMLVAPVVDARRNEVYTALYRIVANGLEKVSDDLVMPLAQLASKIREDVILAGDSKATDAASLLSTNHLEAVTLDRDRLDARARMIAVIGAVRLVRGDVDRAESLEPLYVRPPEPAIRALSTATGQEGLWSTERKNSFGSI
jgi:tRNA threonylcarbamoyladenosine biosynthesis protein TsaB